MLTKEYSIRYSKKAKYLQLRFSASGLEVVVPAKNKLTHHDIVNFVQQKQPWIERTWQRINHQSPIQSQALPTHIYLPAIDETWKVRYLETKHKKIKLFQHHDLQLTILGNVKNKNYCLALLQNWLKKFAEMPLYLQLTLLANETKLNFKKMTIRNNTSRWGSCSSNGTISLCCKILFLPKELMRHVLLHELCHTKVMNHGSAFWQLLKTFDNHAEQHAKELKAMSYKMPSWVVASETKEV